MDLDLADAVRDLNTNYDGTKMFTAVSGAIDSEMMFYFPDLVLDPDITYRVTFDIATPGDLFDGTLIALMLHRPGAEVTIDTNLTFVGEFQPSLLFAFPAPGSPRTLMPYTVGTNIGNWNYAMKQQPPTTQPHFRIGAASELYGIALEGIALTPLPGNADLQRRLY